MGRAKKKLQLTPCLPEIPAWGYDRTEDVPDVCLRRDVVKSMHINGIILASSGPVGARIPSKLEILSLIERALDDECFGLAIEIAVAHLLAAKALSDPWWRLDQFRTRVDEWTYHLWVMAQVVYEENQGLQVPYDGARSREKNLQGYRFRGKRWASANLGRRSR